MIQLLGLLMPVVGQLIDKYVPDKNAQVKAKAEAESKLIELIGKSDEKQTDINKVEAAHASMLVAGWRPFIGWVCGAGLAFYYVPQFILAAVLWVRLAWGADVLPPYPATPDGMMELVMAMLGLGGLRTLEKIKGVTR